MKDIQINTKNGSIAVADVKFVDWEHSNSLTEIIQSCPYMDLLNFSVEDVQRLLQFDCSLDYTTQQVIDMMKLVELAEYVGYFKFTEEISKKFCDIIKNNDPASILQGFQQ